MRSKKRRILGIAAICLSIFLVSQAVLATPSTVEDEIIDVLSHNAEYFQQNDLFADIFRSIGWWIISLLRTICVTAEQLYLYCFELLTFSTSDNIQNLISSMQPIYHAILLLSITAVGLMLMMFNSKFPNFLRSILLTVAIATCSFYVISQLNKALYDTETDTGLVTWAIGENHTVANDVVNANITDLLYVDQKEDNGLLGFSKENIENYHYPELADEMFNSIRVREVLNYEDEQLSEAGKELLKKKLKVTAGSTFTTGDVSNGWGWNSEGDSDFGNEFYYRYYVNYPICILTLFAFAAVYLAMAFVVVKIIINLVIGQILSILYSADLTGSKKTWMILNTMKDGYIALFLTALSIRIYTLFQAWLNDLFVDHGIVNAIILVFLAFAIICGPSIIEKVTGQNVGLSGGLGMMYAAKQAVHGAASIPGHLASAGKTLANGFGWAADKAVKPMPGTPSSFSSNGSLPDTGKDMPGLPNSPNNPSGGGGTGGNASVRNNGENHSENSPEGLHKENGLEAEMRKMSNDTSAQGQYDSMIKNMNAAPSELQNDSIASRMQENLNSENTNNLDDKPEQLDGAMQKMSQGTQEIGEKNNLNMATSDLDNIMKEMPGNQAVGGEKNSLNEASSGLENSMKEMPGNQAVAGEKRNETLEDTHTIEQGSSLGGNYSTYGSNSNDLSGGNVNNLNPANTGAGSSIAEMQRQLGNAKKIDEELKDTLMDE